MNVNDEHIQNQIEQSGASHGIEGEVYKKVFETLQKEPDFKLSPRFADQVIAKIDAKRESSRDVLWLCVGIFLMLVTAGVAIVFTHARFSMEAFKFLTGSPGLIIFGILFIIVLHWVDKKLIRRPSI